MKASTPGHPTLPVCPFSTVFPFTSLHEALDELVGAEATLHEAYWYEPESVPLWQVRVWETQEEPYETDDARYAATELPFATVSPLKEHD